MQSRCVRIFSLHVFFFIPFWHAWESHAFFGHFPSSHATLAKSHNSQLNSRLHIYKTHYVKKYSILSSLIQWTIIFRIEAHWIQMWLWTSARNKCFVVFQLRKQSQYHIWLCHRVSLTQYSDFLLQLVSVFQFSSS